MGVILIITPDDEIKIKEYENYGSLHDAVNGPIEHVPNYSDNRSRFRFDRVSDTEMDMWCNEEYLLQDELGRVNALATLLSANPAPIYGNVCLTKSVFVENNGWDSTGLDAEFDKDGNLIGDDAFLFYEALRETIKNNKELLSSLHAQFDNKLGRFYEVNYILPGEIMDNEEDIER